MNDFGNNVGPIDTNNQDFIKTNFEYPGWKGLQLNKPIAITEYLSNANLNNIHGNIIRSEVYHKPTNDQWYNNNITYSQNPEFNGYNINQKESTNISMKFLNNYVKMANFEAPEYINNYFFFVNNKSKSVNVINSIFINLPVQYKLFQISVLENSITNGDSDGKIEVYDFGQGPFYGNYDLKLSFKNIVKKINIGIRLESLNNESTLFEIYSSVNQNCSVIFA